MLLLIIWLVLVAVDASDNKLNSIDLMGTNECNACHGPSHRGHVSYTTSLNAPEVLLNDTDVLLGISITNNDYPLSSSSVQLEPNDDFSLVSGEQATKNIGDVSRGESITVEWEVFVHVSDAKSTNVQVSFTGTAIDHKTYTYNNVVTKSIFISTTPTPILKVLSNPPTGSTFYTGQEFLGTLEVSNVGNLGMNNLVISTEGSVTVNGEKELIILALNPRDKLDFTIGLDTSKTGLNKIIITSTGEINQEVTVEISIKNPPPTPISLVIGRIIGYFAYLTLFASVITGVARHSLRKRFSGRKLRILHADLSNLGFTLAAIHAFTLLIPNSPWSSNYRWYEIVPSSIPTEIASFGLELGRWGLLIMYISIVSGYYFSKIVQKWGRKVGIKIHMLSYLALIAGMAHAVTIGGTASNPFVTFLFILSILAVGFIKYSESKHKTQKAKARRVRQIEGKERVEISAELVISSTEPLPEVEEPSSSAISVVHDMRSGRERGIGIVCWNCLTLNDEDAKYCKNCSKQIDGKICRACNKRNDNDANFCKYCAHNAFFDDKEVS